MAVPALTEPPVDGTRVGLRGPDALDGQKPAARGGVARDGPEPDVRRRWLLIAVSGAIGFLVSIDSSTISVANPRIASSLHASIGDTQWITTAFLLSFTVLLAGGGTLADRFGRARVLLAGLVFFALGSTGAALAQDVLELVTSRILVGAGAAAMMPSSISLFRSQFRLERQPTALGIWTGCAISGAAIAPIGAGWLLGHGSWRIVFALVAGCTGVMFVLVGVALRGAHRGSADVPLMAARNTVVGIGLAALVWGLIRAGASGWGSPGAIVPALAGIVVLAALAWRTRSTFGANEGQPLVARTIGSCLSVVTLLSIGSVGTIFFTSIYLQRVGGASPLQAGVRLLPYLGVGAVISPLMGSLAGRYGERRLFVCSLALMILGLAGLSRLRASSSYADVWPFLLLIGIGYAALTPAALNLLMRSAPPERAGLLAALLAGANQFGGVLAVAVLGSVLSSTVSGQFRAVLSSLHVHATFGGAATNGLAQGIPAVLAGASPHEQALIHAASLEAFSRAMGLAFVGATAAALLALIIVATLWRQLKLRGAERAAPGRTPRPR